SAPAPSPTGVRVLTSSQATTGAPSSASPTRPESRLPRERPSLRSMVRPLATMNTASPSTPSSSSSTAASTSRSPRGSAVCTSRARVDMLEYSAISSSRPLRTRRRSLRKTSRYSPHQKAVPVSAPSMHSSSSRAGPHPHTILTRPRRRRQASHPVQQEGEQPARHRCQGQDPAQAVPQGQDELPQRRGGQIGQRRGAADHRVLEPQPARQQRRPEGVVAAGGDEIRPLQPRRVEEPVRQDQVLLGGA